MKIYFTPRCLLYSKCKVNDIEFSFYLPNGDKVTTTECFGNILGYTECTYKDITYTNISYESKIIGEKEVPGLSILPITCIIMIPIFLLKLLGLLRK